MKTVLMFVAVTVVALLAGMLAGNLSRPSTTVETQAATVVDGRGQALADFKLERTDGAAFDKASLAGRWSLVFFGYTHCPDVCPVTLALLKDVFRNHLADEVRSLVDVVFVSVDPERDSIEHLKSYVEFFDGAFKGVTGTEDDLQRLTRSLGVVYVKVPNDADPASYLVDHSTVLLLINPDAELHAVFSAPHTAEPIAHDVTALVAQE